MPSGVAGYKSEVYVKTAGTKYDQGDVGSSGTDSERVAGANNVSAPNGFNMLDTTDFSDVAQAQKPGLKSGEWTISGNYNEETSTGLATLKTAFEGRSEVEVAVVPDDDGVSNPDGYEMTAYVSQFQIDSSHDGKVEFSVTIVSSDGNGWAALASP
jgi:predicted secreted protein